MPKIRAIQALEVLDSRGFPTLHVTVTTDEGILGQALVPSGASTGSLEALELRDGEQRFHGKGVQKALAHIQGPLQELLVGESVLDQRHIDQLLIHADGTPNKSRFGANALLGISLAVAKAGAKSTKLPLYRYLGGTNAHILPCPMMNVINGGAHADNLLDFQEFMIRPIGASSFRHAVQMGSEIFHTLKKILSQKSLKTNVGDEGGFAPEFSSNEEALDTLLFAIEQAGYQPGQEVTLALDCAASEYFDQSQQLYTEGNTHRTSAQMVEYLSQLTQNYPIDSIEDGLDEQDFEGWKLLTKALPHIQIVGDDLFVTNPQLIENGIREHLANAVLIKCNQIGTLTETLEAIRITQTHNYQAIISHRSGETEDTTIADLAVAFNTQQIKTGSLCRTDRVAKYNRLIQIEHELQSCASFAPHATKRSSLQPNQQA